MKDRNLQQRKMELFLEGLNSQLGADELHEYVEWNLRVDELLGRKVIMRNRRSE